MSAGGSGQNFYFSAGIRRAMEAWDIRAHEKPVQVTDCLGEFPGRDVYAVRARNERDERSLSSIYDASLELFERIADGYRGIRIQLLQPPRFRRCLGFLQVVDLGDNHLEALAAFWYDLRRQPAAPCVVFLSRYKDPRCRESQRGRIHGVVNHIVALLRQIGWQTAAGIARLTVKRILNHLEGDVTDLYDRYSYGAEKREALKTWARRLHVLVSNLREVKTEA